MLLEFVSLTRRNHGLEHATMNFLGSKYPRRPFAGHSDWRGFWIMGDIATPELLEVVQQALNALQSGRHDLAIHANCGTNLVVSGAMAGMAGVVGMVGAGEERRAKLDRIPLVITLATLALMLSRPVGLCSGST
ncbi:MAG: hypothetical protein DRI56_00155 [Chloroflexota bacterium]|nr:MAG: hypothetical protein DRI56_00155 [Chloroflexota bacterium]